MYFGQYSRTMPVSYIMLEDGWRQLITLKPFAAVQPTVQRGSINSFRIE